MTTKLTKYIIFHISVSASQKNTIRFPYWKQTVLYWSVVEPQGGAAHTDTMPLVIRIPMKTLFLSATLVPVSPNQTMTFTIAKKNRSDQISRKRSKTNTINLLFIFSFLNFCHAKRGKEMCDKS